MTRCRIDTDDMQYMSPAQAADGSRLAGLDFASFNSLEATKSAAKDALQQHVPDKDGARASSIRNIEEATSSGRVLAECFEAAVESSLQQPTFVLDFPVEISPLAKPHRSKPGLVERFELYIAGATCPSFVSHPCLTKCQIG